MAKIAIFGFNRLSFEVLKRLDHVLHDILVIEQDPSAAGQAIDKGLNVISIEFRNDDELKRVGIGRDIEYLFCFLMQESDNVFLTLSARALDSRLTIISAVEEPDCVDKLIAAGANKVIDPYQICGRKFCDLIQKPEITTVLDHTVFGRGDLRVAEIVIQEGSVLVNKMVSELKLNVDYNLILIGILDKELGDDFHFVIGEQLHKLDVGDVLVLLGPSRALRLFTKEINHV